MLYGQVYELCCTGGCINYAVRAIFVFLFGFLSFLSLSREVFVLVDFSWTFRRNGVFFVEFSSKWWFFH